MYLYYPRIFVWLPEFLDKSPIACQNPECQYYKDFSHPMTVKGWNDNPIARRVVGLDQNYFIITKRIQCRKNPNSDSSGCGKSLNYYDPVVLSQLDPALAAEFPAFLTHRSGIDKTLMALIRAGLGHRLSSSAWSKVLREIHVREHDLREIKYLRTFKGILNLRKTMDIECHTINLFQLLIMNQSMLDFIHLGGLSTEFIWISWKRSVQLWTNVSQL